MTELQFGGVFVNAVKLELLRELVSGLEGIKAVAVSRLDLLLKNLKPMA